MTDPATVAFLHVPKVGGMSYGRLLADLLPGEHWFPPIGLDITPEQASRDFDPDEVRRYRLVAGHFDYSICRRAPYLRAVTLLRDPVDRVVSAYHYSLLGNVPDTAIWREYLLRHDITLFDFLHDDELMRAITTSAVRQLAGYLWSDDAGPDSDDALLAEAKANLVSCVHVGIQKRLQDSALLLGHDLGVGQVPEVPHLNASGGGSVEIPPPLSERLEDRLALEYELYRYGVALFEQRFAASGLTPAAAPDPGPGRPLPGRSVDRSGINDWIELEWKPASGTTVGAQFGQPVPVSVLPFDRVNDGSGDTFVVERHATVNTGVNWIRVPRGLYQVESSLWCRPDEAWAPDEWTVGLNLIWCREEPFWRTPEAAVAGLPARPDIYLSRVLSVPPSVPVPPPAPIPLSLSGLIRVPGTGHLSLLMGSSLPVHSTGTERHTLLVAKIG